MIGKYGSEQLAYFVNFNVLNFFCLVGVILISSAILSVVSRKKSLFFTGIGCILLASIYTIFDALFVSVFIGEYNSLIIKIFMPILLSFMTCGFILGLGGSLYIQAKMEQDGRCSLFSKITYIFALIGLIITVLFLAFLKNIASYIAIPEEIFADFTAYSKIALIGGFFGSVQIFFMYFLVAEGKTKLLIISIFLPLLCKIVFDWAFVVILKFGMSSSAVSTLASQFIGFLIPFIHFFYGKGKLRLRKMNVKLD